MNVFEMLELIQKQNTYVSERLYAQLAYACSLSKVNGNSYDKIIEESAKYACSKIKLHGVLTKEDSLISEKILSVLKDEAKKYKTICVSHAHIDMNWMWGFNETASLTVDTFRTMLDLMNEFKDFTFSQSQASTYRIIEEYAPYMLDEIKKRVHEGRWELTASTWVETDKNMPNGESLCRHILYTKKYLSSLFNINPDDLTIDFEPDTFGHNAQVPEILVNGKIKYYYHCRGNDKNVLYRFKSKSGKEILTYCDPQFYQGDVYYSMLGEIPIICNHFGIDTLVKIYGVGDHGGGPTRRDIMRIIDMMTWPVMPEIRFGTLKEFFTILEKHKDNFPVVEDEQNFVFTGCYTSQSRIKMANRKSEDRLFESENITALAKLAGDTTTYPNSYKKAWEKVLFNQFHDILPGSGVIETREYAMGEFQKAMSYTGISANSALRYIASHIKTNLNEEITGDSISEGAGVGYGVGHTSGYTLPQTERGFGKRRAFHLFNTTEYERETIETIRVWDWNYNHFRAVITSSDGAVLPYQCSSAGQHYWGHMFKDFLVKVKIPAFSYITVYLDEKAQDSVQYIRPDAPRVDYIEDTPIVLENDKVKITFDRLTMKVFSFIDKESGSDIVNSPSFYFRLVTENTNHGMTSWRVGNYIDIHDLNEKENVRITHINLNGLRKNIQYELSFRSSVLKVHVFLDEGSSIPDFAVTCDWHERGNPSSIPQLQFYAPYGYTESKYRYDIPFGVIDRTPKAYDVPANSFAVSLNENGKSLIAITDSKYGFRGYDNSLLIDLIRASTEPDPYPEYGIHHFRFSVGLVNADNNINLFKARSEKIHPVVFVSASRANEKQTLPENFEFIKLKGDFKVSCMKISEDLKGIIFRIYEVNGKETEGELSINYDILSAHFCDINENITGNIELDDNSFKMSLKPWNMLNIAVILK